MSRRTGDLRVSFFCRPLAGASLAIEHVIACHLVLAGAHQREFDLILDVFDMQGAAAGQMPQQGLLDLTGQTGNRVAHARTGGRLAAFNSQKRLGHGDGNFSRIEMREFAVAADDANSAGCRSDQLAARLGGGRCPGTSRLRNGLNFHG